ncbi:MAG: formate/nitrite transporter family protein [Acetobacteraceae bacterium]|nr:formate/nitrite transporter family protein [Acetobacteraceae bacterium]
MPDDLGNRAEAETGPNPREIHRVIREEGEAQLTRHSGAVAWSGLAAGLSMGFSFLTMALLQGGLPDAPWRTLVSGFGYTLGFLIVILGRQQLFTESTLTPVLPVLTGPRLDKLPLLFRFWGVVLGANLVGTWLFAWGIAHEWLFRPDVWQALREIGSEASAHPFGTTLIKAVLAGWLIALMVWLLPSAGSARMLIIATLTYVVAIGQFSHSIAGSVEAAFAVFVGASGGGDYLWHFLLPTVLGNTIGGVALVAMLNHAPLATEA